MSNTRTKPRPAWLTIPQIAARYQLDRITVWRWCVSGKLPAKKLGRCWRVRRRDWVRFRDAGFTPAADPAPSPAKVERDRLARSAAADKRLKELGV